MIVQSEIEGHMNIVNHVLTNFAETQWVSFKWTLTEEPKYQNYEADRHYSWVGSIQIPEAIQSNRAKLSITADERYAVCLHNSTTYCVMAFWDYGYFIDASSASYLTLTEVMETCAPTPEALKQSVHALHDYLSLNPVPIRTHGSKKPTQLDTLVETNVGVKIRTRVLKKHS